MNRACDACEMEAVDRERRKLFHAAAAVSGSLFGFGCADKSAAPSATPAGAVPSARAVAWARGGVAAIGKSYLDPFATGLSGACTLTCKRTLGPCYAKTVERRDISEGRPGLPLRLSFLLVDASCNPVRGATLDVWHASKEGFYSGEEASRMCTGGDADATAHRFYRGVQKTDERGRVDFDTCFPGWYRGRAVHIHFTARLGDDEYVTSQFFFPQEVIADVYGVHEDYAPRGQPDTPNDRDGIAGSDVESVLLDVRRMPDGVMLASKSIVLRASLDQEICGDTGPGRPPGGRPPNGAPGGPPPDGRTREGANP